MGIAPLCPSYGLKIHPYDTPEILCLPVEGGLKKYLTWMVKETT
jgi:uncharacterized protein involved in tolerance to divalent cations